MNRVEFAVVISQPRGNCFAIAPMQVTLGFEFREGVSESARDVFRRPLGDDEPGAVLRHHADALAEFARPRVHVAKDAAMGLL